MLCTSPCVEPLMAQSGHTTTAVAMSATGGKADEHGHVAWPGSVTDDRSGPNSQRAQVTADDWSVLGTAH
jgi:hypothetical protein